MKPEQRARKWIEKKAKKGVRSHPVGTIAFYGPDDSRATKVAVAILPDKQSDASELRRWFTDTGDLRKDDTIFVEIAAFLWEQEVHSVVMVDRILGCPHEEGIDYPEGGVCPQCPYWVGRDRWSGKLKAY
ncbi:hypothetical protein [Mesorhizobium neociceri]|uniref:Uncharacterized protein n=1 Tax=Mesorhizobium neociceri TaxID=1307853 RepID=A0A838BDG3_9HYPH|nr:hypothetical protein [Mesorhizobium neociceri]MBA1144525.1 hypothetical protein [Mesorhizobium neociceri]